MSSPYANARSLPFLIAVAVVVGALIGMLLPLDESPEDCARYLTAHCAQDWPGGASDTEMQQCEEHAVRVCFAGEN